MTWIKFLPESVARTLTRLKAERINNPNAATFYPFDMCINGKWVAFEIDLEQSTQTNLETGTVREIREVTITYGSDPVKAPQDRRRKTDSGEEKASMEDTNMTDPKLHDAIVHAGNSNAKLQ